eukprot:2150998-Lingulodinium_polyedra.AAC.1
MRKSFLRWRREQPLAPWQRDRRAMGPTTDDIHQLRDPNLYYVDRMFAEKTNELFERIVCQGRIDGE